MGHDCIRFPLFMCVESMVSFTDLKALACQIADNMETIFLSLDYYHEIKNKLKY